MHATNHRRFTGTLATALLLAGPIWTGCRDAPSAPRGIPATSRSALVATASTLEDVALLRALIARLEAEGTLTAGQANALTSKVDAAVRRLGAGGGSSGDHIVDALTNQVHAFVRARVLTPQQAQPLLDAALSLAGKGVARRPLAAGYRFTCALTLAGMAQCWGNNALGQLGDGTSVMRLVPVAVQGGLTLRQIAAGSDHACGLTGDGVAYCWGGNTWGQLGDGSTMERPAATVVTTALRFAAITAGAYHTCGLTRAGVAYCWGRNFPGVLGDGTVADRHVPTLVTGGLLFAQLRAGGFHTCGIAAGGSGTYCWGWNHFGELGDGTLIDRTAPTPVAGTTAFTRVVPYAYHTCALTGGGQAYCWGLTEQGALVPAPVPGGIVFATLGEGGVRGTHTCGVSAAGPTYCWGPNNYGQVGDGTNVGRAEPTLVAGGHAFTLVTGGGEHNCGRTAAGAILCWGGNFDGQLGDGTTISRTTPTPVSGGGT